MEQSGWFKLENNGQAKAPAPKAQSAEVRKEPAPKTIMEEKYYPMQGKGLATKIPQPAAPLPSIVQSRGRESQTDPYGDAPQELHSQTVGPTGPVLLQDTVLHETLEQFVHSRPRDRVVHTKGDVYKRQVCDPVHREGGQRAGRQHQSHRLCPL